MGAAEEEKPKDEDLVVWYKASVGKGFKPRIDDVEVSRETSEFWKASRKEGHFRSREKARKHLREVLQGKITERWALLHSIPAEIERIKAAINGIDDL